MVVIIIVLASCEKCNKQVRQELTIFATFQANILLRPSGFLLWTLFPKKMSTEFKVDTLAFILTKFEGTFRDLDALV